MKKKTPKFCWFCGTKLKWSTWNPVPYFSGSSGKQSHTRRLECENALNHQDRVLSESYYSLTQQKYL